MEKERDKNWDAFTLFLLEKNRELYKYIYELEKEIRRLRRKIETLEEELYSCMRRKIVKEKEYDKKLKSVIDEELESIENEIIEWFKKRGIYEDIKEALRDNDYRRLVDIVGSEDIVYTIISLRDKILRDDK